MIYALNIILGETNYDQYDISNNACTYYNV